MLWLWASVAMAALELPPCAVVNATVLDKKGRGFDTRGVVVKEDTARMLLLHDARFSDGSVEGFKSWKVVGVKLEDAFTGNACPDAVGMGGLGTGNMEPPFQLRRFVVDRKPFGDSGWRTSEAEDGPQPASLLLPDGTWLPLTVHLAGNAVYLPSHPQLEGLGSGLPLVDPEGRLLGLTTGYQACGEVAWAVSAARLRLEATFDWSDLFGLMRALGGDIDEHTERSEALFALSRGAVSADGGATSSEWTAAMSCVVADFSQRQAWEPIRLINRDAHRVKLKYGKSPELVSTERHARAMCEGMVVFSDGRPSLVDVRGCPADYAEAAREALAGSKLKGKLPGPVRIQMDLPVRY